MDQEIETVLGELKAWVEQRHGRGLRLARMLDVSPQLVSDWFGGRATPKLEAWLKIQALLKKSEKARKQAIGEK